MSGISSKLAKGPCLLIGLMGFLCAHPALALVITNVSVVNITPSSFSIIWAGSPQSTPSISIFSDSGGSTNLAGQLGIEFYPLHTGDPKITNSYFKRQNKAAIQQSAINQGLVQVRVTDCTPNTAYYYRLQLSSTNGQQIVYPPSGPLPSVTTALENAFVAESRQVIITVPANNVAGSVVVLSNSATASLLAAVVGDGVASNEVYFNLSDLLAAGGQTNYLPQGNQSFTAEILGTSSRAASQTFSLNFTGSFLVGAAQSDTFSIQPTISIGSAVLQEGQGANVAISLNAPSPVTNISFVLNVPTNRFSSLTLQSLSPQLATATLQTVGLNSFQISFSSGAGQVLQGIQELAQLNFTTATGKSSAFVPLSPQTVQGLNADGSAANSFRVQGGRIVIIGPEPLLDSLISTGGSRQLVLYGIPGNSYQLQSAPDLLNSNGWANVMRLGLTNQAETISGLDSSKSIIFYRAYEFTTQSPILDATGNVNGTETLEIYGTSGLAYEVDYATSLFPANWQVLTRVPLTNSFQFIAGLNSSTPDVFYRALLLNADPPIIVPQPSGTSRSLLVYGLSGTNYTLQYATNLSTPVTWLPVLSYRLTNAFQTITNLGANSSPSIFYRLQKQ